MYNINRCFGFKMLRFDVPPITFDTVKLTAHIADALVEQIKENIKNGLNNDGVPFEPYNKTSPKSGQRVDLKETGRMLSQLKAKLKNGVIQIGVYGSRNEIAEKLNETKNWTFLKWGVTLEKAVQRALDEYIMNQINGVNE
jgi:hypothetical protein